ncbi:MAG TPA: DUF4129 domain-containing protein [Reyranella sp.]|nr:DUF4129 domain-containing protein [Reyranella sp.]
MRWIVLAVAVALASAAGAAPAGDQKVRDAVAGVYDWAGYQRELPGEQEPPKPQPPPRLWHLPSDLGAIVDYLLIGLVVVVLVVVALRLLSGEWTLSRRAAEPPAPEQQTPGTARREQLQERLQSADRAAVAGDWASAIHILLLTSIDLLRRRVGQDVPDAMTSRELVGEARLPAETREDFAALVAAAELCHFGGRAADQPLYERCRAHYERLWGMAPEAAA